MQFLKTDLEHLQIITIVFDDGETLQPELLPNLHLPEIDYTKGVVVDGCAPLWLYVHLMQLWHIARWSAVTHPFGGGAIVTKSHDSCVVVGSVQSTALIV